MSSYQMQLQCVAIEFDRRRYGRGREEALKQWDLRMYVRASSCYGCNRIHQPKWNTPAAASGKWILVSVFKTVMTDHIIPHPLPMWDE